MQSDTNNKHESRLTSERPNELDRIKLIEDLSKCVIALTGHISQMRKEIEELSEKIMITVNRDGSSNDK
jgi:hypothetical protein